MKTSLFIIWAILFISLPVAIVRCGDEATDAKKEKTVSGFVYKPPTIPKGDNVIFVETFNDEEAQERWVISEDPEFTGEWDFSEGKGTFNFEGDKGLIVNSVARKHAIASTFPKEFDPKDKNLIIQYELRLQNGLECGGAYIKLLTKGTEPRDLTKFNNKTPYTIMFGPDKCGSDNKVHFIFRHQNPISKEIEEKHMNTTVSARIDSKTHLYTIEIRPDNTFTLYIDGEEQKSGSLLEDFDPPVVPPKEIDDPKDKKPADWVDVAKIPDPNAEKPEDWDVPAEIPDPDATKPEDWDDEFDGDWEPNTIPNPDYKGQWEAPLIDNPDYKGPWSPRKIPNPNYFEDEHPHNFNVMDAIGIELWTMTDGILFNNFIITTDKAVADKFLESFKIRREEEDRLEQEEAKKNEKPGQTFAEQATELYNIVASWALENPPLAAASAVGGLIPVILLFYCTRGGSKSAPLTRRQSPKEKKEKDNDVAETKSETSSQAKVEEIEDESTTKGSPVSKTRKRKI